MADRRDEADGSLKREAAQAKDWIWGLKALD